VARGRPICEICRYENIGKKHRPSNSAIPRRRQVDAIDWTQISAELDAQGCAVIETAHAPAMRLARGTLSDDTRFRSRIVMGRHGFGRGEYKYFSYPLPT